MRLSLKTVLAGTALLAAAAVTPALAGDGTVHVMSVRLPDGAVETIRYTGDHPPQVVLIPEASMVAMPMMMPSADPFAALERISAAMDQQVAAMLRQAAASPFMPMPAIPPETSGYSFVSTSSGSGVCTQSVRITYASGEAKPQVVSSTTGDCGPGHSAQTPSEVAVPPRPDRPHAASGLIEAKAATPVTSPLRQVAWNQ